MADAGIEIINTELHGWVKEADQERGPRKGENGNWDGDRTHYGKRYEGIKDTEVFSEKL